MWLQGSRVYPKTKVYRDIVMTNGGISTEGKRQVNYPGDFSEVYDCFVILQGHSLTSTYKPGPHWADVRGIPQLVYVKVESFDKDKAVVVVYSSESEAAGEADNSVMFTLVVIGC